VPGSDGRSLKTVNRKWARIGSKSGERFENGLTSVVEWQLSAGRLTRKETLTAVADTEIKNWEFALPSTGSSVSEGGNTFALTGREGTLKAAFQPMKGTTFSVLAAGDSKLGKGVLGAIPIYVIAQAKDISLKKGESISWSLSLELAR
jgi:hypothetical protein